MPEVLSTLRADLLAKLLLASFFGGAIGLDRELKGKPAGLRTNILICVGSALLTDVSMNIGLSAEGARFGDPARLAAQIVTGVGFLGAGTIMQGGGTVTGLTSAATIWVVAAIGITVGAGLFIEAAGAAALVAIVLAWVGRFEHKLRRIRRVVHMTIRAKPHTSLDALRETLRADGINVQWHQIYDHLHDRTFELRLVGPAVQFEVVTSSLLQRDDVLSVHAG